MKIYVIFTLIVCLLFVQCKQTILKTTIVDDKNIIRSVQTTGDSLEVGDVAYPFPMNDSWQVNKEKIDSEFVYTTQRSFRDVETLNAYCRDDSIATHSHINLDKKFRWFFTYYRYNEAFPVLSDFEYLPMEDFLTEAEYQAYLADEDSMDYEDKVDEWLSASMFEVLWRDLQKAAVKADPEFTPEYMKNRKSEIYTVFIKDDLGDAFLQDDMVAEYLTMMDSLMAPKQSFHLIREDFAASEKMLNDWYTAVGATIGDEFELHVEMPGRIIDTNAQRIDSTHTRVDWQFDGDYFLMRDYEMWAESRTFNTVPSAATGLFFIIGLIFLSNAFIES